MTRQHERFGKELDLILQLVDGNEHTAEELCETLGTTRRNLYYYFEFLRDYGFTLVRRNSSYHLAADSPFFQHIAQNVTFSNEEAALLYKLVEASRQQNKYSESVRQKLRRFYDLEVFANKRLHDRMVQNVNRLYEAMERKRVVVLKKYASPHSGTVSDRAVEPFLFMNDKSDIRCYELASHTNKTFKISRLEGVEIMEDLVWSHEYMHREVFTDMFLFSGEERLHVKLRLGLLARNLLREEYPQSAKMMVAEPDGQHWTFSTDVASYVGISRFILGLSEDIEVLEGEGLRQYLREKVAQMRF